RFRRPAYVPEGTDMSSATLKASMSCQIEPRPGALRLAYRIRNDGETRLGLFNRIATLRADGTQDFAPANAYIDLDGRTLRVRKQVLPVPPDLKMAGRQLPGLTVLDPGKVFQEGWSVETPVRVCEPMQRALLALRSKGGSVVADRPAEADSVELAIGVVEIDSGWRLDPISAAHPDIFQVWPPGQGAAGQQILLQRKELFPPLPLLGSPIVPRDCTLGRWSFDPAPGAGCTGAVRSSDCSSERPSPPDSGEPPKMTVPGWVAVRSGPARQRACSSRPRSARRPRSSTSPTGCATR